MEWNQMASKWKQLKGHAKEEWGKLTGDDLEVIEGQRDKLVAKLQERYGLAREQAQEKADQWVARL